MDHSATVRTLLLLAIGLAVSTTHPVYHHHFTSIVNSNPCLKQCIDQAAIEDVELSILKTANLSGYLTNLNSICNTISTARSCIDACGVDSNPFTLESVTIICAKEVLAEVEVITPCLTQQGNAVVEECKEQCGDYDHINDQVHRLTKQFRPESSQPAQMAEVMAKTNEACAVLKCSDRCTVRQLAEQCGPMEDGRTAGSIVQALVERVLLAQRRDLERMQLVERMASSTPPQCNFMYTVDSMFNEKKDDLVMVVKTQMDDHLQKQPANPVMTPSTPAGDSDKRKELSLALSQFQAHLLRKQFHLLDIQEKNLIRESQKLDLELQLLARKRLQSNLDDGMIKQF